MNIKRNMGLIASLMMSGLMPTPVESTQLDNARRGPIPNPYFPPAKREPQPLTPEQIKAQEKRARKAKRYAKEQGK